MTGGRKGCTSPKATQPREKIQKRRAIYMVEKRERQLSEREGRRREEGEKEKQIENNPVIE